MLASCQILASSMENCEVNWDAVSALATIGVTLVALLLPICLTMREWRRQDEIRCAEVNHKAQALAETQQEVCSAVDRVLAYRDAAIAIFECEPVSRVGIKSVKHIQINAKILSGVLEILQHRQNLSDGVVYSAVAAQQIVFVLVNQTEEVLNAFGSCDPNWKRRKSVLQDLVELSKVTRMRVDAAREYYKLKQSESAIIIRSKYSEICEAIKNDSDDNILKADKLLNESYY